MAVDELGKTSEELIPSQHSGQSNDNFYEHSCASSEEADKLYSAAVDRLLNVNQWGEFAGTVSATFKLTDAEGTPVKRNVWENDYIRIDIPGPGNKAGDGYDWVQVERIDDSEDQEGDIAFMSLTVKPSANPSNKTEGTAHFFEESASSTFIVRKDRTRVIAEIHGRNEHVNKSSSKKIDNIRNTVVAGSAKAGFSDIQWSNLAKGLIHPA